MPVDSLQHAVTTEPKHIIEFRTWMTANGAYLDPHVRYAPGMSIGIASLCSL